MYVNFLLLLRSLRAWVSESCSLKSREIYIHTPEAADLLISLKRPHNHLSHNKKILQYSAPAILQQNLKIQKSVLRIYSSTGASSTSSAGASRAFMLRLIFLSSPLKSTTLAVITCPIERTSAGFSTCCLEI